MKVKPTKGRSFPEKSPRRRFDSRSGVGAPRSKSSKLDVSSLLLMVGMKGGVAEKHVLGAIM